MILPQHPAWHSTDTRQRNHGVSFRVIAQWMRLAGIDQLEALSGLLVFEWTLAGIQGPM